jgi:uncharacterized membrane protein
MITAHVSLLPAMLLAAVPIFGAIALFLGAAILLTGVFFHFVPELTRHDLFFAVTVDKSYRRSDEARATLRQFQTAAWIHTAVGLAVVFAAAATKHVFLPLVGILWQVAGITIAFLRARKRVMPHAMAQTLHREAALAQRQTGVAYWILQVVPFAMLCACGAYLRGNWSRIPERFPVHWGANGEPNGWATRSFGGVYWPLFVALATCVVLAVVSYGVIHWTRQIRAIGSAAVAETRSRRVQVGVLIALQIFFAALFSGVSLMALRPALEQAPSIWLFLVGTLVFVVAVYAVFLHTGQGGSKLIKTASEPEPNIAGHAFVTGDRTPDECWKAGMFYVNRDDPALLVEKRFGIGYTLNFGRPAAWVLMALLIGMALIPLLAGLSSTK